MVTLEVKDTSIMNDGQHEGVIIGLEQRTEPYNYIDLVLESEGTKIKAGYPATVSNESSLGELLKRFGIVLVIGQDMDLDKAIVGKKCKFMTITKVAKPPKTGKFATVIGESVQPVK